MKFGVFDHMDENGAPLDQQFEERLELVEAYDRLGFYAYQLAEHHRTPLGLAPSPGIFLAAVSQRTRRLRFGPLVYSLPLYHPIRLIEEICMLDQLSGGRVVLGLGRGLARREYQGFAIDMAESRARFDESARMILDGLETGVVKGEGKFYPRKPTEIRPRPFRSFKDRTYCIAMSPDSVEAAAHLGAGMAVFSQAPWPSAAKPCSPGAAVSWVDSVWQLGKRRRSRPKPARRWTTCPRSLPRACLTTIRMATRPPSSKWPSSCASR